MAKKFICMITLALVAFFMILPFATLTWAQFAAPASFNLYGDPGTTDTQVITVNGTPGNGNISISVSLDPLGVLSLSTAILPDIGGQVTVTADFTGRTSGDTAISNIKICQGGCATIIVFNEATSSPTSLPVIPGSDQDEIDDILNALNGANISSDLQNSIDILSNASSGDVDTVTSLLSHESSRVSNLQELANLTFNPVFSSVGSRLIALRGGANGLNMQGLDFLVGQEKLSVSKFTNFLTDGGEELPGIFDKLSVFLNGEIGFGDKDGTTREKGFHFNTYEITGGVDYRFTDDIIVGAAIGYVRTEIGIDTSGGNPDADGVTFALYGNYYIKDNFYVDGIVSVGINDFNTSRKIRYTIVDNFNGGTESVNQRMDGDTDALMKSFSIGSGYDFNYKAFTFGPYGRVTYTRIDIEGYKEHASAPGAPGSEWRLHVESQDIDSVTTAFGCQGSYPISTRWAVLTPQARVEWMHEYSSKSRKIHASFVEDSTNTTFFARTDDPDRDFLNWGIGLSAVFTNGRTAFVDYERVVGLDDWTSNMITFGFRWEL